MTRTLEERRMRIEQIKRKRIWMRRVRVSVICVVFCLLCLFVSKIVSAFQKHADISLSVSNQKILQNEEMPTLKAKVEIKDKRNVVLDKESDYTAKQLAEDLKAGKGYTITCKADTAVEGKYEIKLTLDKSLKKKIEEQWGKRLRFTQKDGVLTVKNAVGEWDGKKFKKYDKSYAKDEFVNSKNKVYYFNGDGELVKGLQKIEGHTYYFNSKGVMVTSKWETVDKNKYYFGKDGMAATGFVEKKKGTYYFDENGIMQTGEVRIGLTSCKFDKNGILVDGGQDVVDPSQPMVALTFDDGPGDRTSELLDAFEKYHAHATFFMQGQAVSKNADVVKKMKDIGCELGNHSWNHAQLTKLSVDGIKSQIDRTDAKVEEAAGVPTTVMRPPYGAVNDNVKSTVKKPLIFWSIDTLDWKTRNTQKTIDTVMKNVKDGDIILMHDIHTESVDAALQLIPKLEEAGYQLVTVSEMAQAKGVEMKNGAKYFDFIEQ